MRRNISLFTILFMVAFLLMSNAQTTQAATQNLTSSSNTLMVGKTLTLKIDGVSSKKVKWKSNKKKVATVSNKGIVKAKKAGMATITGKYSGITFKTIVTVVKKFKKVVFYNKNNLKITFNGTGIDSFGHNYVDLKVTNFGNKDIGITIDYILVDSDYIGVSTMYNVPSGFTIYAKVTGLTEDDGEINLSPKKIGFKFYTEDDENNKIIKETKINQKKVR